MKKRNVLLFLLFIFIVYVIYAFGINDNNIEIHSPTWKYFESNENIEKVVSMYDEHFPRISVLLYLKSGLEFSFKVKYLEPGKYALTRIYGFGKYQIWECRYNADTNQYFGIKNDYENIIKTKDIEYIISHAEEYERLIETLPEHSGEKINNTRDEDAKEFFDSLPGEAVQIDEIRWVKYVKVKQPLVQ